MGKADLHTHTTASDGSCEPEDLVRLAAEHSLEALAITDHDSIEGYLLAKEAARQQGVRLIPGAEITARFNDRNIHILAYDFDPGSSAITTLFANQRRARLRRMERILIRLREREGIDLKMDEVKAQARSNNVGRPHVAQLMVRKRIVATVQEAFIRFLGKPEIDRMDTDYVKLEELLPLITDAGGVTSLAHPGPVFSRQEVTELIGTGIDGIESIHPSHNFNQQKAFAKLADEHHLLQTGGSDFHGSGNAYAPWFGVVTLGSARVEALERMARNRKTFSKKTGAVNES